MSSNINFSSIDVNFPIAGRDNSTQGFRDNFISIRTGLQQASSEISTLQSDVENLAIYGASGIGGPGATGATGLPGMQGATGIQGPTGLDGMMGATGATGPYGAIGATGLPGATGQQGLVGSTGPAGSAGATGLPGATGLIGATGIQGSTGLQGATGTPGITGNQGSTGAIGPQGSTGVTGYQGATGAGATGAIGPQGSTGAIGPQGSTGAIGPQGSTGAGATGVTGYQGATGATGPSDSNNISFQQAGTGAILRTAQDKLRETVSVLDFGASGDGVSDDTIAIQNAIIAAGNYGQVIFNSGNTFLLSGAVGLIISSPVTLVFEIGAKLLFNNNNATYIQIRSSDVTLINPWIDGGSLSWIRTGYAAINVNSVTSASYSNIKIIKPRIEQVAGAGILIGSTITTVSDVLIDEAVVKNTKADGVSVIGPASNVSIVAPKCYDTGDDGVSIIGYLAGGSAPKQIQITDALSVNSSARGFTVLGATDVKLTGEVVSSAAQGILILKDSDTYNTYATERVSVDVRVYNSTGNGVEIGRNAKDISGNIAVNYCQGLRGIMIASSVGFECNRVNLNVSAHYCANTGIEINNALQVSLGSVNVSNNGTYGLVVSSGTKNFSYGTCNAYNNNTSSTAGVDNILLDGVTNFILGSTISVDDNSVPTIERTLDLSSCSNGIIGLFMGIKNTTYTAFNIQTSCSNVIGSSGQGVGTYSSCGTISSAPTVTHLPPGSSILDTTGNKIYYYTGTVWKSATLT